MNIWKKYNGALIPEVPPHLKIDTDLVLIKEKIIQERAYFARWVSDFDKKKESNFWYLINDKALKLEDYSVNTRSKIRRGFKSFEVKMINKKILIESGFNVYEAAFKRYKTINNPMSRDQFIHFINSLEKSWEFWGVFDKKNNVLVAYSQNKVVNNQCYYSTIKFHVDYLKKYPSYVLYYTMNNYYLNNLNLSYVNEGTRSILHETNVQSFLIDKFRFRKAYCKLHIEYHPLIKPVIYLLYPLRTLFSKSRIKLIKKIGVVLKQEEYHKKNNIG